MFNRKLTAVEITGIASAAAMIFICCGLSPNTERYLCQIPYHALAGWWHYLQRVVPQVSPDAAEVAVAVTSLLVVLIGTHWFCRRLYAASTTASDTTTQKPTWPVRWTLRIVGVLVLMFVCGTAAIGVTHQIGWLMSAKEPMVKRSSYEWSGPISSQNNLKQLGLAVHIGQENSAWLPAPAFTPDGRPMHSWHTALLPYLEYESIYQRIRQDLPWDHPDNQPACREWVRPFHAPLGSDEPYEITHYAPDVRLFDRPRKLSDFPEGASNTLLAGEAVRNPKPWADPLNWRDPRLGPDHPAGFGGPWPNGLTQILMLDGSTRTVAPDAWAKLLRGEPE